MKDMAMDGPGCSAPRVFWVAAMIWVWPSAIVSLGCGGGGTSASASPRVVVYAAHDREFSEPILDAYSRESGVEIAVKYDVESTKTVALTNMIIAEEDRPRCDLFWNNEIVNTIRLKRRGLLRPFSPLGAEDLPAVFKAKDGTWYGFAARARVLLVNTDLVPEGERPQSLLDLADPKWNGRIGLAKPLFGTTATHAACLFAYWGDEKAKAFFESLKANRAKMMSGNKQTAKAVGAGELAFGLTDTDDALGEIAEGRPVVIVYPDRRADQMGTLFIPNTVALIQGSPNPQGAEALAGHLISPETEDALANGPSGQIPLGAKAKAALKVETPKTVKAMEVDFEKAAERFDDVAKWLSALFAE